MSAVQNEGVSQLGLGGVVLLAAAHFLAFVDRSIPSVYAPALKAAFGLSDTQLGALQGPAFVLIYAVGTLLAGHGRNRVPRAQLLALCILVWTSATVIFALASDYRTLLAARLVLGLGQAAFAPTALAVLVAGVPAGRLARSVAIFTSGSAMGRSGALLVGGLVLGALSSGAVVALDLEPWRAAVLLLSLPNLLLAALLLWSVGGGRDDVRHGGLGKAVRHVLQHPKALGLHFLASGGVILMVQAAAAWTPSIFHRIHAVDPATSAIIAGVVVLIAAPAGHLGGGWLLDRRIRTGKGPAPIMAAGAAVAAGAALALAASPGLVSASLAFFFITAGGGAAALAALAGLQPLSPASLRPPMTSLYMAFVTVVGLGLGPFATGVLSDHVFTEARAVASALAALMLAAGSFVALATLYGSGPWRCLAAPATAHVAR